MFFFSSQIKCQTKRKSSIFPKMLVWWNCSPILSYISSGRYYKQNWT